MPSEAEGSGDSAGAETVAADGVSIFLLFEDDIMMVCDIVRIVKTMFVTFCSCSRENILSAYRDLAPDWLRRKSKMLNIL